MADETTTEETSEETTEETKGSEETTTEETTEAKVEKTDDWQTKARKHEREAKRARKEKEALEAKLAEREGADKTEQEKAVDKARAEGEATAKEASSKERRADRLEVAVTRLAAGGFNVGEGDDAKTVRFADSDDALLHIQRAVARGDTDEDEIFDSEGKVNTEALRNALGELIESKPHLIATDGTAKAKASGDADAGKGTAAKSDLESMSVEDHLAHIDPARK